MTGEKRYGRRGFLLVVGGGLSSLAWAGPVSRAFSSFTAGALKTNATGVVSAAAPSTSGFVLTSTGTDFTSQIAPITILDKSTTTTTVNNTATDTTIYTLSVPANTLGTNHMLRVDMGGTYLNNGGSASTLTVRIKFGPVPTVMYADATYSIGTGSTVKSAWELHFILAADASATAQKVRGRFEIGDNAAGATTGSGDLGTATATRNGTMSPIYGTAAVDSTVTQTLLVTMQHSVANTSISIVREGVLTELIQ